MAKLLGRFIANNQIDTDHMINGAITNDKIASATITGAKLAADAKQSVLESKLIAGRNAVTGFIASDASSDTVTTEVEAVATVDTPVTALTAKGIYVGSITGPEDPKRVQIRASGTDNGISDGNGDEIYGILTEDTGVYTLSYKKANGDAFTFTGTPAIDFFFVEVFDFYSQPVESGLGLPVTGVVDATTASALSAHVSSGTHEASAIVVDQTDEMDNSSSTDLQVVLEDFDGAISAAASAASTAQGDATQALSDASDAQADATQALSDASTAASAASTAQGDIDDHIGDAEGAHAASAISVDQTTPMTNFTSTTVQALLEEIDTGWASALSAGDGIDITTGTISADVDDTTLEIDGNSKIAVKDAGIVEAKIADLAVADEKLKSGVADSTELVVSSANVRRGYQFTLTESVSDFLIDIKMRKRASPTGNLKLEIWSDSAGEPGALVDDGTSDVTDVASLSAIYQDVSFMWSTAPTLSTATPYWLILSFESVTFGGANSVYVNTNSLESGIGSTNAGTDWSAANPPSYYWNESIAGDVINLLPSGFIKLDAEQRITASFMPATYLASIDENNMASDSDLFVPTQQSVKAYVTSQIASTSVSKKEILTLTSGDITAKYKDLVGAASDVSDVSTVRVVPVGGIEQEYTVDFTVINDGGSVLRRINWDGLGLESLLEEGDKIQVFFEILFDS